MCRKIFKSIDTKTCRENFTVQNQHSNIFPCMKNDHSTKENKKTILFILYFLSYSQDINLNKKKTFIFIYLFVPGLCCSMWDLVPWLGTEPKFSALVVWSLSHRTKNLIYNNIEKNEVIRNKLKEMKDLYVETTKYFWKESDINKYIGVSSLWIWRLNIIKLFILPKAI